jgi:molybdate transport system substrate-binding protein
MARHSWPRRNTVCEFRIVDADLRTLWLKPVLLIGLSVLGGATTRATCEQARPIVVSAAISLKEAFSEIGRFYQNRTSSQVTFNFAASGELEKQIEAGAPVDVFASAGEKEMDQLQAKQLVDQATRADFARNILVLVVPADSKLELHAFEDLERPSVKRLAIGNPKTVPAGEYAQLLLHKMQLWPKVESRLVLAENVRQVLDYVVREEVEAGIVYATDVQIAQGKATLAARAPDLDDDPIRYPIAVVKDSVNAQAAKQFVDLVRSPEGVRILAKYGFLQPRRQ